MPHPYLFYNRYSEIRGRGGRERREKIKFSEFLLYCAEFHNFNWTKKKKEEKIIERKKLSPRFQAVISDVPKHTQHK